MIATPELAVPVSRLRLYARNPRRGDVEAIKESLRLNGQYRPIVVNRGSATGREHEVLAGNHTLRAARELGWNKIDATYVDVDDEQARRIVLVDNRTNDLASYDLEELLAELEALPSLEGSGYDSTALDDLLEELGAGELPEEDELPPPPPDPETRRGDLYRLGSHRLLCGDARRSDDLERLLGGERASLMWTDPPYGVSYAGKTARALTLENDGAAGLADLLRESFACVDGGLETGAPIYIAHPAGALSVTFGSAFLECGWHLHQTLVWVKDSLVLGRSDYHYRHEPILYGYKPGVGRLGRGGAGWHGGNAETSVLEVTRPKASREHPTAKPPALIERCLRNSSARHDLVLDPFAGSGSTLVACEHAGRRARLIELDPAYCEVIVRRWETLTGGRAERGRL